VLLDAGQTTFNAVSTAGLVEFAARAHGLVIRNMGTERVAYGIHDDASVRPRGILAALFGGRDATS